MTFAQAEKVVLDYVKFLRKLAKKIDDNTDWCALRSADIAELGARVHSLNDVAEELERRWECEKWKCNKKKKVRK